MKVSNKRIALISNKIEKSNKRGRIESAVISPIYRVRLKEVYDNEISSVERLIVQHIYPELDKLVQKQDSLDVFKFFEEVFRGIFIQNFGGLMAGGQVDVLKHKRELGNKVSKIIEGAGKDHKKEFKKTFQRIASVSPLEKEAGLKDALDLSTIFNVNKITTISSDYLVQVQELVLDGVRTGRANKSIIAEIKEKISSKAGNSRSNARLIANDQIQKLNGDLDKLRQKANGIQRYIWRTRKNQAVRDDHEDLDGAIMEWGDPPITVTKGKRSGERNEPGQDINCKCRAEPVIDDLIGERSKKVIKAEEKTQQLKNAGRL